MEKREVREQPLVSIVIPVYNGSNYMRQAIDSALGQTYPNVEVIVVNDGSDDGGKTEAVALSYGSRIRYYRKENGGVSSALNEGIRQMRGEYFSWLSHDDVYTPDKIRNQLACIRMGGPRAIALCACRQIDKDSRFLPEVRGRWPVGKILQLGWHETLELLWRQGYLNGCALLIPKTAFMECGLFHEGLRYCQDLLMWVNIFLHKYSLVYSGQEDVYYRIHNEQLTQTGRELYYSDSRVIADILIPLLCEDGGEREQLLYAYARSNAIYNNREVVRSCIRASRQRRLLGEGDVVKLRLYSAYGAVRPYVRRAYYGLMKNVKTQ